MNVHVHSLGVHREVEEIRRAAILGYELVVRLHYRAEKLHRTEIASVDEHVLLRILLLGGRRTADVSADLDDGGLDRHLQQICLYMAAHHVDDAFEKRARGQGY